MERAHPDHNLISSNRVQGTNVYSVKGEDIGTLDHLMIEKTTGEVTYAVIKFGGFLGFGTGHHPLPWKALSYDPSRGGYVTNVTSDQLHDAPEFSDDAWRNRDWEKRMHKHYEISPYWRGGDI